MSDFWERKSPLQKTKFILSLLLIVLIIVFAIANWQSTEFDLIVKRVQMPRTVLILGSVMFGYLIAAFTEGMYKKKEDKQSGKEHNKEHHSESDE